MESNPSVSLSATQASQSPTRVVSPQSPLKATLPRQVSGNNSLLIRAPLSLDSDKLDDGSNSSVSGISYSSYESEAEGFISGEEEFDFETASERPFVPDPDDETLEIDSEEEDNGVPFVEPVVGFSTVRPKAQVSGDDDDDIEVDEGLGSEVEDDGFSGVVRVPSVGEFGKTEVGVLESEEGGEDEPSLGRDSSVVETSVGNRLLVDKAEPLIDKDPVLDSVSMELVENSVEALVSDSEEDNLLKNPKINEDVKPTVDESSVVVGKEQEMCDLKGGVEDGKNGEVLDVGRSISVDSTTRMDLGLNPKLPTKVEENGVSNINEVELPAEKNTVLGVEIDQASPIIEESIGSNFVEADKDVNFMSDRDSSVEPEQPISLELECGVARVAEEDEFSETKVVSTSVVEEPVNLNSIGADTDVASSVKHINSTDSRVEILKTLPSESNADVAEAEKDYHKKNYADVHEPVSLHRDNNSDGPKLETEAETDFEAPPYEPNDKVDVMDEAQIEDSGIKSTNEVNPFSNYEEEDKDEDSVSGEDVEGILFNGSETAEQIMKELERVSGISSHIGAKSSGDYSLGIDGQIVADSDENVDTDGEGDEKEIFDSAALSALLKAATSAGSEGSRLFSIDRPVGMGSSNRSLQQPHRPNRTSFFTPSGLMVGGESETNLSEEEKKMMEKIQLIRVKFLRLVQRLGHSPEDSIAGQVLHRMILATGRHTNPSFSLEMAKRTAAELEAEGKDDLDFYLNVLVLGKTGVGKSATINSIFGEEKAVIDAFNPATTVVKEIVGTVDGVKIRVFDTPGLRSSVMDQAFNQRVLSSVKKFTNTCPPDIVLYVDRLDTQTRDLNDLPLLRSITSALGASIWRNAIVTLTHAASAPPDGPSGSPLSYEVFVAQRSHVVQQSIGRAVGDLRSMNPSLMNPVCLAESHPLCRKNREGQKVLPNGQSWIPQLLLLCYSMKILSEVSSLSKPQDSIDPRRLFGFRVRSPPLPYLLSSLLQSRPHPKLPNDQGGENVDSDIDLGDLSDSDQDEEDDEYDQLPPFKPLRKSQIDRLSKEQRKAYFDEYDYRVKLLQKKQWREELKRLKEMKKNKGKDNSDNYGYMGEDLDQENETPAAVPVPLPDMVLPPSFDGDNPAYRYRFLEPTSQLLARPVLDSHGWDHDCGYDGVNLEENIAIFGRFPAGVAVQITKDKKEFNIHLDSSVATKHGDNGSTLAGFDIQTIGKQLAYIVRGETKFKILKKNKTAAGFSVTFLGENVATGLKVEDQIAIGKRLVLVGSSGAIRSQGDVAYGANLEARLKDKDYPIGQDQSTLGLSLMRWRGDLALGANFQSQFSVGRSSKVAVRVGLNNKLSGQITVRTSSSEQLQIALLGILPIANVIFKAFWSGAGESYSSY